MTLSVAARVKRFHQNVTNFPGRRSSFLTSIRGGELTSDSGLTFAGLERLSDIEACELLCVPGGFGLTAALADRHFMTQVRRLGHTARYVTSVCSGSLILAAAGLIQGKRAACHWAWQALLAARAELEG